jgi:hypothetical protein
MVRWIKLGTKLASLGAIGMILGSPVLKGLIFALVIKQHLEGARDNRVYTVPKKGALK